MRGLLSDLLAIIIIILLIEAASDDGLVICHIDEDTSEKTCQSFKISFGDGDENE